MKKREGLFSDPEQRMRFGAIVAVVLLVLYLTYVVGWKIAPKIRSIGKIYREATRIERSLPLERIPWRG